SSSGIFTPVPWFSKEEFVQFISDITGEMFGTIPALPEKVIVGSSTILEYDIYQWIPNAKRVILKLKGTWKEGSRFSLAVQQDGDTLSSLVYRQGLEVGWEKPSLSAALFQFFSSVTGLNIGFTTRSKVIKFGRVQVSKGPLLRLRMEWAETTEKFTNSQDSYTQKESPVVAELFTEGVSQSQYTYYRTAAANISIMSLRLYHDFLASPQLYTHFVYGMMHGKVARIRYEEDKATIALGSDETIRAAVIMLNVNPDSRDYSVHKVSKNKKSVGASNIRSISLDKTPEWYYFYYDPNLSTQDLNLYLQSLACLFAGMGT
ncbi:MAG: hypothetical protein IM606_16250, partial [Cytophagales bacterium]|nr:hypothetical protein [Cytophagales bacterium]MCA6499018.1 hypothetical protein [Chitinophagaceae bacterium]MCA6388150.1 hypothetical protein [Cytophagales bacterium]MCA6396736.1 hypothetical protein [Cytophagales bacterium]MCA6403367.1 hypothetical protein [Cytophagales bacterium]